jgi:hypothetical protein
MQHVTEAPVHSFGADAVSLHPPKAQGPLSQS